MPDQDTQLPDSTTKKESEVAANKSSTARKSARTMMHGLPRTLNPLAAFSVRPKVQLIVQEDQEEILLLLRRHLITTLPWIVTALVMIASPLLLSLVPLLNFLPSNYQFMTLVLWYLLVTAYLIEKFLSWYFHVFIITDERIIDVDFLNFLYRNITSAKIENIEDITVEGVGAFQSLFNYGTVRIQTAGQVPELEFELIPKPYQVAKFLNEMLLQEEQEKLEGRVR